MCVCVCVCVRVRSHTLASELCVCVCVGVYTNRRPPSFNFFFEEVCPGRLDFLSSDILPSIDILFSLDLGKNKRFEISPIWCGFV